MTEYSLDPAYGVLTYTTEYSLHKQVLPTLAWVPTSITGTLGSYVAWDTVPIDAEAMWDAMVAKLKPFQDPSSQYTLLEIFTKASPDDPSILVAAKDYAVAGTSAIGGVRKAVQATFNFKTVGAHPMKLVFLDYPHGTAQFDRQAGSALSVDAAALAAEISSTGNAWAGRDKQRVNTLLSVTNTLNEALRKQYRMT